MKRKAPSLRLESHRIQFEIDLDIQEGLERIVSGVRQKDVDLCKDLISKLKKRNKLIKVADKSPGGWTTVHEYEEPSLCCSDSEDDRKLKQAEARAIKKIKFSRKPSTVQAYPNHNGIEKSSSHFMPSDVFSPRASFQLNGGPAWGRGRGAFPFRGQRQATASDICFSCGLTGHFRRSCPNQDSSKGQFKFDWSASQLQRSQADQIETKPAVVTGNK